MGKKITFLILLLVISMMASLLLGSTWLWDGSQRMQAIILLNIRLPRMAGCLLAGAALALSGYVLQALLANPLASPSITGIQSGAGLGNVLVCALAPTLSAGIPASFAGAILTGGLILALCGRFRSSKTTIVLAGLAMGQLCGALIDLILVFFPDALAGYSAFRMGSFAGLTFHKISLSLFVIPAASIITIICARQLELLMLGRDTAQSLGLDSRKWTMVFMALASLLAACVVSYAGLISFAGLIVPHIIKRQIQGNTLAQMAGCVLGGAAFMLVCDLAARILAAPYELPTGIVLSLAGAPYFLWLLLHRKRKRA